MQTPETEDQRTGATSALYNQHSTTPERPTKRPRLSLACNECRKRKVKCDAETPKCKNCRIRGILCETTDPKHPELVVIRKYGVQYLEESGYDPSATSQARVEPTSLVQRNSESVQEHESYDPAFPSVDRPTSWIARSYKAHQALDSTSAARNGQSSVDNECFGQHVLSDSYQSPEMAINSDGTTHRQKLMGGSSLQSLTMFLDLYLQRAGQSRVGHCFRHGMSFAEEFVPPLVLQLPDLPPTSLMDTYLEAYTRNIHPLYPVLALDQFRADVKRIRSYQDASWTPSGGFVDLKSLLQGSDIPSLACIYAVISLGADETANNNTEVGGSFLSAAHGLYAHLVGLPHLNSVQALVLITLALRGRGKEGQGFQVLGSAIRISHSIGLHRSMGPNSSQSRTASSSYPHQKSELYARIWWTCYALEKLMELETTRPSGIPHGQHDQPLPAKILCTTSQSEFRFFIHWVALAQIVEQINELLYRRKREQESTLQILQCISKIDGRLRVWKSKLPEDIQPDEDIYCESTERCFASFLILQYHQTLITLHRASLILPHNQFLDDVQAHVTKLPCHARLRNGEALCTASARATIRLVAQLDGRLQTPLYTLTQTLHGCVVLALGIMRKPQSRTVRSDLELMVTGAELAEAEYSRLGQHPKFIEACTMLQTGMVAYVQQFHQKSTSEKEGQIPRALQRNVQMRNTSNDIATEDTASTQGPLLPPMLAAENDVNFDFTSIFDGTGLEDLWMVGTDIDMYSPLLSCQ